MRFWLFDGAKSATLIRAEGLDDGTPVARLTLLRDDQPVDHWQVRAGDDLRRQLESNATRFRAAMTAAGFELTGEGHPIIPVMIGDAALAAGARVEPTVVITNEVGLGIHPETDLGRRCRDVLGWVNQGWAEVADPALLLVAGQAVPLTDPWTHL